MCLDCYGEYGSPKILNEAVLKAVNLINTIYVFSTVGGNLHVQLDDWNIEDEYWGEFEPFREDSTEYELGIERECFDTMKSMSLEERASALVLHYGGWRVEPPQLNRYHELKQGEKP